MPERPEPTAVRFVLGNCTEPGREAEFNEWYDAYAADCTRPGLLVNAVRYEDEAASGDEAHPRYVAVYDIVSDPELAWPQTQDSPARQVHTRSPLLSVVLRSTYRRIEPIVPVGSAPLPKSITIVLSDWMQPDSELDEWTAGHMADLLARGAVTRATRYTIVEGQPAPPRFLEIYESDGTPGALTSPAERPAASKVRFFGSYTRTSAYP